MFERISARLSRKHIKPTSATPLKTETYGGDSERGDRFVPPAWLSERSGEVKTAATSQLDQARIEYSMVGFQALDPYGDAHILEVRYCRTCFFDCPQSASPCWATVLRRSLLQVDNTSAVKHLFAAVISADRTARGGNFLRRNMHRELVQQIKAVGDVHKAIRAAIFSLDRTWRDMHPFNRNVLDGVSLSAAYVDLSTNILYLASTGGCRVVVGSINSQGELQVTADVGKAAAPSGSSPSGLSSGIATVQLTDTVDTIILGSKGLWYAFSFLSSIKMMCILLWTLSAVHNAAEQIWTCIHACALLLCLCIDASLD